MKKTDSVKNNNVSYSLLLLLAAFVWGIAFVFQSDGGSMIGAYTFNGTRFLIGAAVLIPLTRLLKRRRGSNPAPVQKEPATTRKATWIAGTCCGIALCIASNFQQLGISLGASAGKAGFLTACYIILVPILGRVFLRRRCSWQIWICVLITLCGLYLLCMKGSMMLTLPDLLLMLCALSFAIQILLIDHFTNSVDPVKLVCIQFFTCGLFCWIPALLVDVPAYGGFAGWLAAFAHGPVVLAILYAGIFSSGVGYTLQAIAQSKVDPTVASILMSLESVFSAISGWIILNQRMNARELLGCGLIFLAVILAQVIVDQGGEPATNSTN